MRVLLVDDEAPARAVLREMLAAHPEVEVAGEATNGFEAVRLAAELAPDLVLLDIQMPKLDGFEVLELLGAKAPAVVFCTAHDEHALRAFEVHAVDYLLKPIDPERLATALARAGERLARGEGGAPPAVERLADEARGGSGALERVLIREEGHVHVLPVARIDFVEARDDYLVFHCGKTTYRKQQTLGDLEKRLDPRHFVRIHRSFVLALDRLVGLDLYAKDSWIARLADGTKLPVSRAGHDRLRDAL
jgi:two-component system LytT family response regulator